MQEKFLSTVFGWLGGLWPWGKVLGPGSWRSCPFAHGRVPPNSSWSTGTAPSGPSSWLAVTSGRSRPSERGYCNTCSLLVWALHIPVNPCTAWRCFCFYVVVHALCGMLLISVSFATLQSRVCIVLNNNKASVKLDFACAPVFSGTAFHDTRLAT